MNKINKLVLLFLIIVIVTMSSAQGPSFSSHGSSGTVTTVGFTGGLISVATPTSTPAFTVAGTSGGVPYFNSATTWLSSAAGTAGHLMLWGGAGSAPTDGGANPAAQLHVISFVIDGAGVAIVTGALKDFPTVDYACTINRIDIASDVSGSITVDVWKANAAIPVAGNKISASAPLTLSTAQLAQSGSLTGWTTNVSTNDVFGFSVASATTVTHVVGQIWCQ
jgi:trimeric autotransporter adhesin